MRPNAARPSCGRCCVTLTRRSAVLLGGSRLARRLELARDRGQCLLASAAERAGRHRQRRSRGAATKPLLQPPNRGSRRDDPRRTSDDDVLRPGRATVCARRVLLCQLYRDACRLPPTTVGVSVGGLWPARNRSRCICICSPPSASSRTPFSSADWLARASGDAGSRRGGRRRRPSYRSCCLRAPSTARSVGSRIRVRASLSALSQTFSAAARWCRRCWCSALRPYCVEAREPLRDTRVGFLARDGHCARLRLLSLGLRLARPGRALRAYLRPCRGDTDRSGGDELFPPDRDGSCRRGDRDRRDHHRRPGGRGR